MLVPTKGNKSCKSYLNISSKSKNLWNLLVGYLRAASTKDTTQFDKQSSPFSQFNDPQAYWPNWNLASLSRCNFRRPLNPSQCNCFNFTFSPLLPTLGAPTISSFCSIGFNKICRLAYEPKFSLHWSQIKEWKKNPRIHTRILYL